MEGDDGERRFDSMTQSPGLFTGSVLVVSLTLVLSFSNLLSRTSLIFTPVSSDLF